MISINSIRNNKFYGQIWVRGDCEKLGIKTIETNKFLNLSKIYWSEKEFEENVFYSELRVNKEQLDLLLNS